MECALPELSLKRARVVWRNLTVFNGRHGNRIHRSKPVVQQPCDYYTDQPANFGKACLQGERVTLVLGLAKQAG